MDFGTKKGAFGDKKWKSAVFWSKKQKENGDPREKSILLENWGFGVKKRRSGGKRCWVVAVIRG